MLWIVSRKTNFQLIRNITVEVTNRASISKGILVHVSKFPEKMVFQLMLETVKWICKLQVCRQTIPSYWRQIRKYILIKQGCFSFKTEDLVFAWFCILRMFLESALGILNDQTHSNNLLAIWRWIVWVCLVMLWD